MALKAVGVALHENKLEACDYYPYRVVNTRINGQPSELLLCLTTKTIREVHWTPMKDLAKKKQKLFELAEAGDAKARRELNKLNYDESNRKLNRK